MIPEPSPKTPRFAGDAPIAKRSAYCPVLMGLVNRKTVDY